MAAAGGSGRRVEGADGDPSFCAVDRATPQPAALVVFGDDVEDVADAGGKFGGVIGGSYDSAVPADVEVAGRYPAAAGGGDEDELGPLVVAFPTWTACPA